MAMALGPMLGPMLGGVLDTGFGWRSVFYVYTVAGAALLVLCWIDLGETRPTDGIAARPPLTAVLQEPGFWAFALCTAFSTGAFFVFVAGVPLVAESAFDVSTARVGVFIGSITAGFVAGSFLSARLAPRFALSTMMIAGRLVACAGLMLGLVFVAIGWLTPPVYFGCTVFAGFGNGLTMPGSNTGAMSVKPGLTGSAAGMNAALTVLMGAVLTSVAGVVLTPANAAAALLWLMLACAGAGLVAALWARRLERDAL